MFRVIVISSFAVLALAVPAPDYFYRFVYNGRIVGGVNTTIEKFPHQISLLSYGSHICGGSIIGKTWALTAAHCTQGSAKNYKIRVGSSERTKGGVQYQVGRIVMHPEHTGYDFDYSLLELTEPIEFGDKVKAIQLPQQGEALPAGTITQVTGWGSLSSGGFAPNLLQVVEVPIMDQTKCNDEYGVITDRMVCAGTDLGGKDSCQGDSGGPMITNNKVVGIVSWGRGCALPKVPGVYARVADQRDWIKSVVGF